MSKERLEDIDYRKDIDTNGYIVINKLDYEFLYEQAERVQELEEENEQLKDDVNRMSNEYLHGVKQQNKRYREALEEIVHQENLKETNVFGYDHEDISSYVEEVARKALEGEAGD